MKHLLLILLPAALLGCAGQPSVEEKTTAAVGDTVCERETRVGTSLPTKHCRSAAQREADRRAAEAIGENIKPGAATTPGRGS